MRHDHLYHPEHLGLPWVLLFLCPYLRLRHHLCLCHRRRPYLALGGHLASHLGSHLHGNQLDLLDPWL